MRHDEHGHVAHGANRVEQAALGIGVERRGGLVEHEDGRATVKGSRDGEPLHLALGKAVAVLAEHRLVAVREPLDELRG